MNTQTETPLTHVRRLQRNIDLVRTLHDGEMHYAIVKHYARLQKHGFYTPEVLPGFKDKVAPVKESTTYNCIYLPLASWTDPKPALQAKLETAMAEVAEKIQTLTAIINEVDDGIFTRTDAKSVIESFVAGALQIAESTEFVLTVETESVQPFAMGNYLTVVKLRDSNPLYRADMAKARTAAEKVEDGTIKTYIDTLPILEHWKETHDAATGVVWTKPKPDLDPALPGSLTSENLAKLGFSPSLLTAIDGWSSAEVMSRSYGPLLSGPVAMGHPMPPPNVTESLVSMLEFADQMAILKEIGAKMTKDSGAQGPFKVVMPTSAFQLPPEDAVYRHPYSVPANRQELKEVPYHPV